MSINIVIILGNLTADIEPIYTPQGVAISNFTVAVNRKYKSNDEWKEEVSFIGVTAIGKLAELCAKYMKKGSKCLVEGKIRQERWEGKDGKQQSKTKVVADNVQFLTRLPKEDDQNESTEVIDDNNS